MGAQFLYARLPHLAPSPINFNVSGDNILVPAVALYRINIHRIWFIVAAGMNIVFKDGVGGTAFNGAASMLANGTFTLDITGEPWFTTTIGNDFVLNTDAAGQVGGVIFYKLDQ